jgi:hypothetical protein
MRPRTRVLWSIFVVFAVASAQVGVADADLRSPGYAAALDDMAQKLDAKYRSLAEMDRKVAPISAQVVIECRADPNGGDCQGIRQVCGAGGARSTGAVGGVCTSLGYLDDQPPSPYTMAEAHELVHACWPGGELGAGSPACVALHKFCALGTTYGYDLAPWMPDVCSSPMEVKFPSLEDQPGPKMLLGYLKFTGAKPATMTNAGGWGLGIDYRAMPTPIPFGGELDISKDNGSWHGRIGLHGGIGLEGDRFSGGILVGFRRGGLTHLGYDFPGELLMFGKLGPVAFELDGQAGYRLGSGVTNHFIAEGKLLVPLASARNQGGAVFLGVDWATENGERFTSFVLGGGIH